MLMGLTLRNPDLREYEQIPVTDSVIVLPSASSCGYQANKKGMEGKGRMHVLSP